jgi:hypothetical protein
MSRSRRSAGQPPAPLEFFLDRGLGRGVAEELTRLGWVIHRIVDVYPDDARDVPDEQWIEHGVERGWVPLCKDGRIKGRDKERSPLVIHQATLFFLDSQKIQVAEMVRRFHQSRHKIERRARRGGPAIYAVTAEGVEKRWP